jgi:ribosome modulation factor
VLSKLIQFDTYNEYDEYAVSSVPGSGVKVLYGTQISCNETADDTDWLFVKELMIYIGRAVSATQVELFFLRLQTSLRLSFWLVFCLAGRPHVMGVAVGNEVELLHTQLLGPPKWILEQNSGHLLRLSSHFFRKVPQFDTIKMDITGQSAQMCPVFSQENLQQEVCGGHVGWRAARNGQFVGRATRILRVF